MADGGFIGALEFFGESHFTQTSAVNGATDGMLAGWTIKQLNDLVRDSGVLGNKLLQTLGEYSMQLSNMSNTAGKGGAAAARRRVSMHDTVTLSAAASKAAAAAAEAAGGEPVKRDAKMETFYLQKLKKQEMATKVRHRTRLGHTSPQAHCLTQASHASPHASPSLSAGGDGGGRCRG